MQTPIENIAICDIVMKYSKWKESELRTLFFPIGATLDFSQIHFSECTRLEDLMHEIGAYKSKGESRRANRLGAIPQGWTEMWANKKRKIWIWNPSDSTYRYYDND